MNLAPFLPSPSPIISPCHAPFLLGLSDGQEEKLVLKRARHADDAAFAASVAPSGAANFLKSGTSFTLNAFVRSVCSSTEGTLLPLACRPVADSAVHHPSLSSLPRSVRKCK